MTSAACKLIYEQIFGSSGRNPRWFSTSNSVNWEDAIMRHTILRTSSIGAAHLQVRTIDASCPLYRADEATAAAAFGGNAPFWPFLWAGGWAVASHLLAAARPLDDALRRGPLVTLDLGCGGGICTLAALAAASCSTTPPPLAMVANDIDPVALAATRINVRRTVDRDRRSYPWLQDLPDDGVAAALDRRLLLDQRNLLAMGGAELCDALQQYVVLAHSSASGHAPPTAGAHAASVHTVDSHTNSSISPSSLLSLPSPSLVVLLGDMMYDSATGKALLRLVRTLLLLEEGAADDATRRAALGLSPVDGGPLGHRHLRLPQFRQVTVLIGDPGRYAFKQLVRLQPPSGHAHASTSSTPLPVDSSATQLSLGLTARLVGEYSPPVSNPGALSGNQLANEAVGTEDLPCPVEGVDGFESAAGGSVAVVQLSLR